MTKIEELLKNEKVQWKKLGEVCEEITDYVAAGSFKTIADNVKYYNEPNYAQLVRTKDIKSKFLNKDTFVYIDENAFHFLYRVNLDKECIILPNIGNCGEVYYILPEYLPYEKNVLGPNAILLRSESVNNKFLYYLFSENSFQQNLYKITSKTGQGKFNKTDLKKIEVPIPSIEIQNKIVTMLDKFTNYVTELQAELQARNKQYDYYKNKLLSEEYLKNFSKELTKEITVDWKPVGELFEFKNGLNKGKEFFGKGTPIINYTDVYKKNKICISDLKGLVETTEDEQKRYSIKRGDVFFTRTSETREEIGKASVLLEDVERGVFSGFVLRARPITELLLPEYCAYCFETHEVRKNIIRYSTYTTRALTNGGNLSNLKIPVPSKKIQSQIVKVLDKFKDLIEDVKGLLPQEIEQRQKQYEYYREKLLTFAQECDKHTP